MQRRGMPRTETDAWGGVEYCSKGIKGRREAVHVLIHRPARR